MSTDWYGLIEHIEVVSGAPIEREIDLILSVPCGRILVTGPPASGKTLFLGLIRQILLSGRNDACTISRDNGTHILSWTAHPERPHDEPVREFHFRMRNPVFCLDYELSERLVRDVPFILKWVGHGRPRDFTELE